MSTEPADSWWVMQKWRARECGRGNGRCEDWMLGRRMRWIIDERPSRDEALDATWWGLDEGSGSVGVCDWI